MDKSHNPEFTMLEVYAAYRDYLWMMGMVEEMMAHVAQEVNGSTQVSMGGTVIDFTPPGNGSACSTPSGRRTGLDLQEA